MEGLKLFLSVCVFAAMIALCLLRFDWAGMTALVAGALGFLGWSLTGGNISWGERIGNGYVGAFMGVVLGYLAGGLAQILWQRLGN